MSSPVDSSLREKPLLLIVDDDPLIADTLTFALGSSFEVISSHSRPHCIRLLRQLKHSPELALVDLGLPPLPHRPDEGFALILELLQISPQMCIVVLSGQSDDDNARHARTLGAVDFVAKPSHPRELQEILQRALAFRAVESGHPLEKALGGSTSPLIGESLAIQKLRTQLSQYAELPFPVLIEGESGCGKEIIASHCLHINTQRGNKPFFALNCAAISPSLVEPTLFGYAKGAFTGATTAKSGYFEDAADGTLFLDEIGELPLDLQAKLLRVLENGEYQRVGETHRRVSQARIVAATNRDLRKEIRAGNFRADLYHRLSVFSISAPPLRDMDNDKLLLLDYFGKLYATQAKQAGFSFTEDARALWLRYAFPGNVRELRNIVIRLTAKYSGRSVSSRELAPEFDLMDEEIDKDAGKRPQAPSPVFITPEEDVEEAIDTALRRLQQREPFSLDHLLGETERNYIEASLKLTHGNVSRAARILGVNRTTLYNRMEAMQFRATADKDHDVS